MFGALVATGWIVASLITAPCATFVPTTTTAVASHTDDTGTADATPGDGLSLAPAAPTERQGRRSPLPLPPIGGAGIGVAGAAGAVLIHRRRPGAGGTARNPLFVYVPGHGGDPDGFADLAGRIGIAPGDIRVFDYRWAWPSADSVEASRRAPTGDAADALNGYLAALGSDGRPIYVVGHSKGGAVITQVVSRWDDHPEMTVGSVQGAAILDPPIASGPLGLLQSIGWLHGDTADDGLFDPIRCDWRGCSDIRDGLGERSGVEVVIVRNPDAGFTNFYGNPDGVRVYDLDDGGGSLFSRFPNPIAMLKRMSEAHNSVLHSDVVADCIAAEARSTGSCEWPGSTSFSPAWGRGSSGSGPLVE